MRFTLIFAPRFTKKASFLTLQKKKYGKNFFVIEDNILNCTPPFKAKEIKRQKLKIFVCHSK